MHARRLLGTALLSMATVASWATTLTLEGMGLRSEEARAAAIENAARTYTKNLEVLTRREREMQRRAGMRTFPVSTPVRVQLQGIQPRARSRGGSSNFTLQFESSGSSAFNSDYQALLQSVYTQVQPTLNLLFGLPSDARPVRVINFDSEIGDRDAVVGGIYVNDNGVGEREIRFPVYADGSGIKREVAAVNFVHTLLLAYLGSTELVSDGWTEGLVRAVTMRACRTPGALPGSLDLELVEAVLDSTYDIGRFYDWNNQRALSGPVFIAPNLRSQPLPLGGSVGGLYLLRHQMAGSAWQKVLTEYPTFAQSFLQSVYANPSNFTTVDQLTALAQTTVTGLGGSGVEGLPFAAWARRQFVLDPSPQPGFRMQVQPFPVVDALGGSDFGVFAVQAHAFQTQSNGDELLLRETSYPIYWSPDFTRIFASAQDDRIELFQGYGSVVPNFPGSPFSGQPYRVTVDVPIRDGIERVSLPAGAIATTANPTPNNFYGTVTGVPESSLQTLTVQLQYGSTVRNFNVRNFAFGGLVEDTAFQGSLPLTVRVQRTIAGDTTPILTRRVNKGPGELGLVLDVDAVFSKTLELDGGVQLVGWPLEPWASRANEALGLATDQTQVSRWNPEQARFDFFPLSGSVRQGHGAFVRVDLPRTVTLSGKQVANQPIAVALRQGWNMIANPLSRSISLNEIAVVTESNFPKRFADAAGNEIGPDLFRYSPAPTDEITLVSERGSYVSVSALQAGEAAFVKVLSPTGATLVFGLQAGASRSLPGVTTSTPAAQWGMRIGLTGPQESSEAFIGQRSNATAQFDARWDSEYPPGGGGVQVAVGTRQFRDIRGYGRAATWPIQVTGLRPGRTYTLTFTPDSTRMQRYRFKDPLRRFTRDWSGTQSYTFLATAPVRQLSIQTVAPR